MSDKLRIALDPTSAAVLARTIAQRASLELALRSQLELIYAQKRLSGQWALSEDGAFLVRVQEENKETPDNGEAQEYKGPKLAE
jgi:hypothetical protein